MTSLIKYDAACRALAEAKATDEVKDVRDKAEAMRVYAHQAKNRQLEIDAAEIRIRAERRLGELIVEQKETVGLNTGGWANRESCGTSTEPQDRKPTLADAGIDKKLSSHAQKVAAIPEDEFEEIVGDWRNTLEEANDRVTTNILVAAEKVHNHRAQGTGENEWYTPVEYIEAAREVLGTIDLDPASSQFAQKTVAADSFFTIDDDGLKQLWAGSIWLNPPYAQPAIHNFVEKLSESVESGSVTAAIMLTHNYTDTRWFHIAAKNAKAICFTRGRIGFLSPEGKRAAPTQGQAFFYYGDDPLTFAEVFSQFGLVVRVMQPIEYSK